MGEFLYNGKLLYYTDYNEGDDEALLLLKSPGENSAIRNAVGSAFRRPDADGRGRRVIWIDFLGQGLSKSSEDGQGVRTDPEERACQLKEVLERLFLEKTDFTIGDKEGAEIFCAFAASWPEMIGKTYVPEGLREALENAASGHEELKIEGITYFSCSDVGEFGTRLRATVYGLDKECPFCGRTMEMGYIYGAQTSAAYWTADPTQVGTTFEFGPVDKIFQLRSRYGKRTLTEALTGPDINDYSRGYLCRSCGKMLIDMSPALVYYEDPIYLKANEGKIDPSLPRKSEKPEGVLKKYFGSLVRNHDGEEIKEPKQKVKSKKYKDDEPKRRGIFGPKVE